MKPGVGVNLPMGQASEITAKPQTWDQILLHVVPESVIRAMAEGDVLQIVVFSIFFAIALGMIGEKGRPVVAWCEARRRNDVQVHEHRHALRADRRRRGDRLHGRPRRAAACCGTWRGWWPRSTSRWPC